MGFLVVEAGLLLGGAAIASGALLYYFTKENYKDFQPLWAIVIIYLAFVVTISPVGLLVADVSYSESGPAEHSSLIYTGWCVLWWATQALSWVVLPLLQDYCDSGHFTFRGRLWYAVKQNVKLYIILGIILGGLLIYVVVVSKGGLTTANCLGVAVASSNAFGLLLIILFLGYGLVQVPRWFWFHSTRANTLLLNRWRCVELFEKLETKRLHWGELRSFVDANITKVQDTGNDELVSGMECCLRLVSSMQTGRSGSNPYLDDDDLAGLDVTNHAGITKLHQRCISLKRSLEATSYQWAALVRETMELEEYEKIAESGEMRRSASSPLANKSYLAMGYNLHAKKIVLRIAAAVCAVVSAVFVFSFGVAVPFNRKLSVVRFLVVSAPPAVQHTSVLLLMPYTALCCYWSLFRFKLFDFHLLVPKFSNPVNLCFTATFLCRLIIPLCFSFLNTCDLVGDESGDTIAYTQAVVANMNTVNLLGERFNQYMPCMLLLVAIGTATDLMPKALNSCGLAVFMFGNKEGLEAERVQEGADLIHREAGTATAALQARRQAPAQGSDNPLRFGRLGSTNASPEGTDLDDEA